MPSSSVILSVPSFPAEYRFTGVTCIRQNHPLKLTTSADASESASAVNGALLQPVKITLSVTESDAEHRSGWSRAMADALAAIRASRALCVLSTPLRTFSNLLLSDLTVTRDESCPDGFSAEITFTETLSSGDAKQDDRASSVSPSGASAARTVSGSASAPSPFQQLLQRAGIDL